MPDTPPDVRMRGFASRSTVEVATEWIDSVLPDFASLGTERVALVNAATRILAADCQSQVAVPGFARSMMDGHALRAEATHGATPYNSLPFEIVGTSLPGAPFEGQIATGQAVRIMTGAPMPSGANAVLPVEHSQTSDQTLLAMGELSVGKHVGSAGEDVQAGSTVLRAGRALRPQDLGLLSSIGVGEVAVIRRPIVRILITGNELLPAGTAPEGHRITDANGPMLQALVTRDGGEPIMPGLISDNRESLLAAMCEPADVILVSGGSSVGQDDHAPRLVAEHGTLAIHGIAMRPSSPAGMGQLDQTLIFLLPGNPVSCLCAYDFFAGRAIRALGGREREWPHRTVSATLSGKLVSAVGRVDYARVRFDSEGHVAPLAISGASVLSSTTQADGFVIVPADSEGYPSGAVVEVMLY